MNQAQALGAAIGQIQTAPPDLEDIANMIASNLESLRSINADNSALADRLFGGEPSPDKASPATPPRPAARIDLLRDLGGAVAHANHIAKRLNRLG